MVPKQPVARNNVSHYRLVMSCDLYVRVECDSGRRVWCVGGVLPCVGCQSACAVHRPNGTRARNAPFRIAPAPLRNRQIAFGGGRFPARRISHRCVPLKGALGRAVGTGARALPRGGHSAPACPSSVGSAPHPPMSGIRLGRNTSRRRLPPLCGDACIPPPVRAPAPFPPHVRWRATGTCPFLRCASRAPYKEQGERVGSQLPVEFSRHPSPFSAMVARSGLDGRRHEAEAVTAGDADGGKRDAADPATGGIPTEPGDGRPRRMRTRRPVGIRRSRRCADPTATLWLSADRMCWAGNAAAVSRTRAGQRDAWRWTRPRRQSGDCRAGRGRSQALSATGG